MTRQNILRLQMATCLPILCKCIEQAPRMSCIVVESCQEALSRKK
jgi:hypothetical protein